MADFRQQIHNRLHKRLGVTAQYIPQVGDARLVTVKLKLGVAIYGEGMELIGDEDQLVFLLADIPNPKKSELFEVSGKQYQLVKKLQSDGLRAIWSIKSAD